MRAILIAFFVFAHVLSECFLALLAHEDHFCNLLLEDDLVFRRDTRCNQTIVCNKARISIPAYSEYVYFEYNQLYSTAAGNPLTTSDNSLQESKCVVTGRACHTNLPISVKSDAPRCNLLPWYQWNRHIPRQNNLTCAAAYGTSQK